MNFPMLFLLVVSIFVPTSGKHMCAGGQISGWGVRNGQNQPKWPSLSRGGGGGWGRGRGGGGGRAGRKRREGGGGGGGGGGGVWAERAKSGKGIKGKLFPWFAFWGSTPLPPPPRSYMQVRYPSALQGVS